MMKLQLTQQLTQRQKRIYRFLKEHDLGVVSTVTPDGNPHGSVVYYTIRPGFLVQFLTKTGTRKHENLMYNDRIMLTVYEPHTQTTAQVTGIAVERGGLNDINEVAGNIFTGLSQKKGPGVPPIMKLQAGAFTSFQIEPVQIRMATYTTTLPGRHDELFESIESFDLEDD